MYGVIRQRASNIFTAAQREQNTVARILSSVKWFIRPFTEVMLQY